MQRRFTMSIRHLLLIFFVIFLRLFSRYWENESTDPMTNDDLSNYFIQDIEDSILHPVLRHIQIAFYSQHNLVSRPSFFVTPGIIPESTLSITSDSIFFVILVMAISGFHYAF